ncbi:unnamed protein product [Macrosiphum euphorbiae]|uniref:Uncharacterized protein n=1 Tax=Macrosiphum euphorbiae TaxID=13131 RepID=A0AAV0Y4N9_9HEMI|nr:unnamed protein product [Macrosiphum euphorbiae]
MTFSVVVFKNENVVEAVPSNWLSKDGIKCAWPKSNFNPQKRIEKMMHPNTYEYNWYSVRVLATDIISLKEAKMKATKATYTSDLSSSNEGKETRKDRFKKQFDDENCLKNSIQRTKKDKILEAVPQTALSPPKFIEGSDVTDIDDSDADMTYTPQKLNGKRKSPVKLFDERVREKNSRINYKPNLLCGSIKSPQKLSLSENNVTIMNSPTGIWNITDDNDGKDNMTIHNNKFNNKLEKIQKELNGKIVKYYIYLGT